MPRLHGVLKAPTGSKRLGERLIAIAVAQRIAYECPRQGFAPRRRARHGRRFALAELRRHPLSTEASRAIVSSSASARAMGKTGGGLRYGARLATAPVQARLLRRTQRLFRFLLLRQGS
jgi:hypothetical protein